MDTSGNWHRVFLNLLHEAIEADDFEQAAVFRDYVAELDKFDTVGCALSVRALSLGLLQADISLKSGRLASSCSLRTSYLLCSGRQLSAAAQLPAHACSPAAP